MEVIRVSSKLYPATYINDVRAKLAKTNSVELHALEGGIFTAIKAAESLINYGYAKLSRFETSILDDEGSSGKFRGVTKILIRLEKTANFEALNKEFESKRASRQ